MPGEWSNTASVDVVTSVEPSLYDYFTCKDPTNPSGTWTEHFSVDDEWAWVYMCWETENITVTHTVSVNFRSPSGQWCVDVWYIIPSGEPRWCIWIGLPIDNDPAYCDFLPAGDPGEWDYDIHLNGNEVGSGYFYLE